MKQSKEKEKYKKKMINNAIHVSHATLAENTKKKSFAAITFAV